MRSAWASASRRASPPTTVSERASRSRRRQWSTSLWRATPTSHATVSDGTASRRTASTAARNVSEVRSSATGAEPVRATR